MLGLSQKVLLEKARTLIRAGQLDGAYALLTESTVRDHRQGQALLEQLTPRLLKRAEEHVAAGRLEEALADVERATVIGGKRPETLALRDQVLGELDAGKKAKNKKRALAESVRGHLRAGRLDAARDRLEELPAAATVHGELGREVTRQNEERDFLSGRIRDHLQYGELPSALQVAAQLVTQYGGATAEDELLRTVSRAATAALVESLEAADLSRARELAVKLQPLVESGYAEATWRDALDLVDEAARAVQKSDWSQARLLVGRLSSQWPTAKWINQCQEQLRIIEDGVREVRSGPLAPIAPTDGVLENSISVAQTLNERPDVASASSHAAALGDAQRWILWIDGVGSYLLLSQDRITVGRSGSSSRPTIPLNADLHGTHVEFLRVDGDYFAVARGEVRVDGKNVEKHLLADRDELLLGSRTRLTFRLPTKLSATAMLSLGSRQRLPGDVRSIVLLDEHLLIGNDGECHITVPKQSERIVLSRDGDGFRLTGPEPLVVDGRLMESVGAIPVGVRVEIGSVAFTITAESGPTPDGFGEGGTG